MAIVKQTPIFFVLLLAVASIWTSNGLEPYTSNLSLRSAAVTGKKNVRQLQKKKECNFECEPADMSVVYQFIQQLGGLILDAGDDSDSLDTASMMSELTSEVDTIFNKSDKEIEALKGNGDNYLQTSISTLFYLSQKKVSANQATITDYLIGLLEVITLLIDALSGILGIWNPDSGAIAILDTISIVLTTLIEVLAIILSFIGLLARNVLNVLTLTTKQISDINDTVTAIDGVFDNVSCSVNALQCQIDTIQD